MAAAGDVPGGDSEPNLGDEVNSSGGAVAESGDVGDSNHLVANEILDDSSREVGTDEISKDEPDPAKQELS